MKLTNTKNILSFLKPIELEKEISNFSELMKVVQENNPEYTFLPKDFFESAIEHANDFKELDNGTWVQLGVWKGGGALFFKSLMNELDIIEKLYLFDTYGKIPTNKLKHEKDVEFANFFNVKDQTSYINNVKSLFEQFKLIENVHFVESDIHNIKKGEVPGKISFLFIDLDFFEPVYEALFLFYDNVIPGGIIIIDDYYNELFNCKEAVDCFINEKNINWKYVSKFSSYSIKIIKK